MIGAMSDIGNLRTVNEDYLDYYTCDDYKLYVVADGMGGHNAGDIASKICVNKIIEYIKKKYNKEERIEDMLMNAVKYANNVIYFKSLENKKYKGMGTTVTFAFVCNRKIYVVNVGDSCFFTIKNNYISKITKDHSLIQELIDDGVLSKQEAKEHPNKNVITRSIGIEKNVDADLFLLDEDDETFYLLCTDGLLRDIDYNEIVTHFNKDTKNLHNVCKELITLTKERGGRDNVSLIIFGGTSADDR